MKSFEQLAKWLALAFLLLVWSVSMHAQLNEGGIAGAVTDSSDAVVGGASVKISNLQTGLVVESKTDSIGYYRALHLQPGAYQIRVEAHGFKSTILENIPVNVDNTTRADVKLQVGTAGGIVEGNEAARSEERRVGKKS